MKLKSDERGVERPRAQKERLLDAADEDVAAAVHVAGGAGAGKAGRDEAAIVCAALEDASSAVFPAAVSTPDAGVELQLSPSANASAAAWKLWPL
jgi:hypothetical protein